MKSKTIFTWLITIAALSVFGFLLTNLFIQQTALAAGVSGVMLQNGDVMITVDAEPSWWVPQTALDGLPHCSISKNSVTCSKKVVDKEIGSSTYGLNVYRTFMRNDYDLSSVGWGGFNNCVNWMSQYGCDANNCDEYDGKKCTTSIGSGNTQSSTVQCTLDSHCVEGTMGYKGTKCYAGKCSSPIVSTKECNQKGYYYCKGEGAVYRCNEVFGVNKLSYIGNVHAQRGVCQLVCKNGVSSELDSRWSQFCTELTLEQREELSLEEKERIDIAQTNLTPEQVIAGLDESGRLRQSCKNTEVKVNIGSSTICMPKPVPPKPADVCGDSVCTGVETKDSCKEDCDVTVPPTCGDGKLDDGETCTNCLKDQPLDKCRTDGCETNPTLPGCDKPLSLWEFIKLFVTENWVAVTILGGLLVALIVTFVTDRKKRGR